MARTTRCHPLACWFRPINDDGHCFVRTVANVGFVVRNAVQAEIDEVNDVFDSGIAIIVIGRDVDRFPVFAGRDNVLDLMREDIFRTYQHFFSEFVVPYGCQRTG